MGEVELEISGDESYPDQSDFVNGTGYWILVIYFREVKIWIIIKISHKEVSLGK